MGLITEVCMIIDIYNASDEVKGKGIKNFIVKNKNKKKIKKAITRIVDTPALQNSIVEEFIYIYNSTKDTLPIKNLETGYNEDRNVLWMQYEKGKSKLYLSLTPKDDSKNISVTFTDGAIGSYPNRFNVYYNFYYNGIDKIRVAIMEYAADLIKSLIMEYLISRFED